MEEFAQFIMAAILKLVVFLVILWIGKKISSRVSRYFSSMPFCERAKVEGFADISKISYYILLIVTWYVALYYVGINLTPFLNFILTNVIIVFGVAVGAFGLAWALNSVSQEQANRIVTRLAKKLKDLFVGIK